MSPLRILSLGLIVGCVAACGGSGGPSKKKPDENNATTGATNNSTNATNNTTNNTTGGTNNPTNNVTNGTLCVRIAPQAFDFGTVEVGSTLERTLSIANCSESDDLNVNGLEFPEAFSSIALAGQILAPSESIDVPVYFSPAEGKGYVGSLKVLTSAGDATAAVQGMGIFVDGGCPTVVAQVREVGSTQYTDSLMMDSLGTVELTTENSTASGDVIGQEWVIVQRPASSVSAFEPSSTSANPRLFIDQPGSYTLEAQVFATDSPPQCPGDQVQITATAGPNDASFQLTWDTPDDANQTDAFGTDLDLHYLHPNGNWDMAPWDCYWLNAEGDWAGDGIARVDIDDTDGAGPENITHSSPAGGPYDIGVYYYSQSTFGASYATLRVYVGAQLKFEVTDTFLESEGTFLHVGSFDPTTGTVTSIGSISDGFPP